MIDHPGSLFASPAQRTLLFCSNFVIVKFAIRNLELIKTEIGRYVILPLHRVTTHALVDAGSLRTTLGDGTQNGKGYANELGFECKQQLCSLCSTGLVICPFEVSTSFESVAFYFPQCLENGGRVGMR